MIPTFIVVEKPLTWSLDLPDAVRILSPRDYLSDPALQKLRRARVINLCHDYSYQSAGYYVSLLGEARGHRPMPNVATLRNLHGRPVTPLPTVQQIIQHSLRDIQSDLFTLSVYFGRNLAKRHDRLARALFSLFPAPLLQGQFSRGADGVWRLRGISALSARQIPADHLDFVRDAVERWVHRPTPPRTSTPPRYTLAILVDPKEKNPPSNAGALKRFVRAGERQNIAVEFIGADDISSLSEYDALFIRATTSVENFTFRFARRAAAEGIPVIDDPRSILHCTNKVFLSELFLRHDIPAPRTEILYAGSKVEVPPTLGLPLVLKKPDSSFSQGVVKVKDEAAFQAATAALFRETDLVLAQAFTPSDFDWRIGVLDGEPLYACRYYMARGHWQIYKQPTTERGTVQVGDADTLPLDQVPSQILDTAVRATLLIGNGLYGVDVKEINGQPLVIEINDNPSIDQGCEDAVIKDTLYDKIIASFVRRIEARMTAAL
jgi:glutathione synthase/RimK-type ligase-like ATP-grasp enzyme